MQRDKYTMMQKLLLLTATTLIAACASSPRSVSISANELQHRITEELIIPITVLEIFDVHLTNPVIKLDAESERLNAQLDTRIGNPLSGEPLVGKIKISGTLRYDAASNAIMLADSRIENLDIRNSGLQENYSQLFNLLAAKLGSGLLDNIPLYTLKPDDLKIGNTRYAPRDFKIIGNDLRVTLIPQ